MVNILKRVPHEVSPYAFPRRPGIVTAVFYSADHAQLHEINVRLEGTFRIAHLAYAPVPESTVEITSEMTVQTMPQVMEIVTAVICSEEDEGFDLLLYNETGCPLPIAAGYEAATAPGIVLEATYDPFTGHLSARFEGKGSQGWIRAGHADGDTNLVAKYLDHMQENFGIAPNIVLY